MNSASEQNILVRIFLMTWLWSIFAGFYLVAYSFWVPTLFSNLIVIVSLVVLTLALGLVLLYDGFGAALALGGRSTWQILPLKRVWRIAGGLLLLSYLSVYLPSKGRIVAHWPLDLAITLIAGLMMLTYGVINK